MAFNIAAILALPLLLIFGNCMPNEQNSQNETTEHEISNKSDTVKYSKEYIINAHKYCSVDKKEMLKSDSCACFYCLKVYPTKEIIDWTLPSGKAGANAICPHCGIDAVIGSKSGMPINDPDFLKAMYDYWF